MKLGPSCGNFHVLYLLLLEGSQGVMSKHCLGKQDGLEANSIYQYPNYLSLV